MRSVSSELTATPKASGFQLKWRFLVLLTLIIPLTVATKFIPTGDMSFDERQFQVKMRDFLTSQQAQFTQPALTYKSLQLMPFSYKKCQGGVIVLPPSDTWENAVARRTPEGHIYKFRYKDYLGDEQPKYRATFNELSQILLHPISTENRRQPILALTATPACMSTIQDIDWEQFWPH